MKRRGGTGGKPITVRLDDTACVVDERRARCNEAIATANDGQVFLRVDAAVLDRREELRSNRPRRASCSASARSCLRSLSAISRTFRGFATITS
jgi:hypothetical protein